MRQYPEARARHRRLLAAALAWLLGGGALLLSTLVPAYSDQLGWTGAFWMLAAPLAVLLALEPGLPLKLLAAWLRRRRRPALRAAWN